MVPMSHVRLCLRLAECVAEEKVRGCEIRCIEVDDERDVHTKLQNHIPTDPHLSDFVHPQVHIFPKPNTLSFSHIEIHEDCFSFSRASRRNQLL